MCVVMSDLLCVPFHCSAYEYWHKQKGLLCVVRIGAMCYRGHLIDMSTLYHLISEFCLVVKLSSNIVTENCRRIWVLSSMTAHVLPLWFPAVSNARGTDPKSHNHVWTVDSKQARQGPCCYDFIDYWRCEFELSFYPRAFVGPGKGPSPNLTSSLPVIMLNCHFSWTDELEWHTVTI